ncbi:MAG: LysE family translocator [Alphaproteobacteria bacterium]|nr:LysE family translocator [Alphaproteobacteria bacterium]
MLSNFLEGLIIGFAVAAPVGPIGVLCIRRTLNHGPLAGFLSGLGAATADTVYGFVAAFGLTAISGFLLDMETWLRLGGGTFLIWLGIRAWRSRPAEAQAANTKRGLGLLSGYLATTVLTLANPSTILSFLAIFAGLGLASESRAYTHASILVVGVFVGSAAWWLFLAFLASVFRQKLDGTGMKWINRFSAVLLAGFGAVIVLGAG